MANRVRAWPATFHGTIYLALRAMQAINHFCYQKSLVIQVKQHTTVSFQRGTLSVATFNPAILAQRGPASFESVGQPDLVHDILSIVRKVIRDAMNPPAESRKTLWYTTAKPAINEKFRLLE
ncbi:hypothetical protein EV191_103327 [Tamaricihabitans halophyticus]|uniref:Uncharacterized protein n=1 Tax=Tamaricihabitans halophyticus TaxID=1262583 RepID=A0A4R2QW24_9PSEU|nr:hypothetical protein [Tamaricihabitans halophyticus]TCP54283.1 hypothetical protein EV191_103327 [Tamaricihabitans halophyticus]